MLLMMMANYKEGDGAKIEINGKSLDKNTWNAMVKLGQTGNDVNF